MGLVEVDLIIACGLGSSFGSVGGRECDSGVGDGRRGMMGNGGVLFPRCRINRRVGRVIRGRGGDVSNGGLRFFQGGFPSRDWAW